MTKLQEQIKDLLIQYGTKVADKAAARVFYQGDSMDRQYVAEEVLDANIGTIYKIISAIEEDAYKKQQENAGWESYGKGIEMGDL